MSSNIAQALEAQEAQRMLGGFPDTAGRPSEGGLEEPVIEFVHVTKVFHLYKSDQRRFLGALNQERKRKGAHTHQLVGTKKKGGYMGSIKANSDLSFQIYRGEAVAFFGSNGAGKSTALKMVTGVAYPTSGEVIVRGRVSALLELTTGFDKHLTGRENINMRGQILGLTRQEIQALEERVIDFAELDLYIDQPLRTYSSGMRARLGFAFAVSIDLDILVVDETLSVGDKRFRKKCIQRIREIMLDEDVTVLFVTHATETAKEFCTRGIVLDKGTKVFDGPINKAIHYYNRYL